MTVARNLSLLSPNVSTSGTVNNAGLTNSSITINGTAVSLGGTGTLSIPVSTINDSTTVGQNLVKLANPGAITFLRVNADNTVSALSGSAFRTAIGGSTVGRNIFTLTNPSAVTFLQMNADNTASALDAASFRTAIGAGTSSTTGTVTSVTGGTYLTGGTITTSGTLAVDATSANTASKVVARDGSGNFSASLITTSGRQENYGIPTTAGTVAGIMGGTSNGTLAVPTQTTSGQDLYKIAGLGYTGSAWTGGAAITFVATDNFTSTTRGTNVVLTAIAAGGFAGSNLTWNGSTLNANGTVLTGNTGTVTGVTGTAPVVSSGGTAPAISMAAATASVNGYMTSTYAAKLDGIAAGATANAGTVTGVTGTAPVVSSGGTAPAISMAAATASVNGYMTSTYAAKLDGIAAGATANTGTVTSVATGTGLSGGPITSTGTVALANTAVTAGSYTLASITVDAQGRITAASNGSASGVTSFSAGTTGLTPSTATTGAVTLAGTLGIANGGTNATTAAAARTNLGATTLGGNLFTLTNVAAIAFPRFNADNTVSSLGAATFRTAIGAGAGTVTSVGGTGTVSGLTLTGTVTSAGNLTLGGTLAVTASNFASQTANTFLCAPSGAAGVPTFRAILAADIPTLNQSTTGTATNATNIAITNDTTTATAQFVTFVAASSGNTGQKVHSTGLTFIASTGSLTASGNITAYSDERLKTDWGVLPKTFVESLAKVKSGTYTRIDSNERQAGSSAQEWQALLPEVVLESQDEKGTLSLAYGNAALVSAVELAKRIVDQEARITELESIIHSMRK